MHVNRCTVVIDDADVQQKIMQLYSSSGLDDATVTISYIILLLDWLGQRHHSREGQIIIRSVGWCGHCPQQAPGIIH